MKVVKLSEHLQIQKVECVKPTNRNGVKFESVLPKRIRILNGSLLN